MWMNSIWPFILLNEKKKNIQQLPAVVSIHVDIWLYLTD